MAAHEGDYIADAAVILARAAALSSAGDLLEEVKHAMTPLMKRVKERDVRCSRSKIKNAVQKKAGAK